MRAKRQSAASVLPEPVSDSMMTTRSSSGMSCAAARCMALGIMLGEFGMSNSVEKSGIAPKN